MTYSNNINSIFASIAKMVTSVSRQFNSPKPTGTSSAEEMQSPLLHPDLPYGREFAGRIGEAQGRFRRQWLAMSMIGMVMSTLMNYLGFRALVPSFPWAALPMALMLEGYLLGTSSLIGKGNRRAHPWLVGLALYFCSLSVGLSVGGLNAGEKQVESRINLPVYQMEDAQNAEGSFATAVAQTQAAALGRIRNELSFYTETNRATAISSGAQSGFARDREERRSDLIALQTRWQALDFSNDFASAKTTDAIWAILRHEHAIIQPLVAETDKLTSGKAIPLPAFPVAPNHDAADSRAGQNDLTGMSQLMRPTLSWLVIVPIALVMDGAPMALAATMRAIESGDHRSDEEPEGVSSGEPSGDPDPEGPTEPLDIADDWNSRQNRYRRIGDDVRIDPFGVACDAAISEMVEAYRAAEQGGMQNLTFMRSLEIFEEETAILRAAAIRLGITPAEVKRHLNASYVRLQKKYSDEMEIQDAKASQRKQKLLLEYKLQSFKDRLALVKQIAELQVELAAVSSRYQAEPETV